MPIVHQSLHLVYQRKRSRGVRKASRMSWKFHQRRILSIKWTPSISSEVNAFPSSCCVQVALDCGGELYGSLTRSPRICAKEQDKRAAAERSVGSSNLLVSCTLTELFFTAGLRREVHDFRTPRSQTHSRVIHKEKLDLPNSGGARSVSPGRGGYSHLSVSLQGEIDWATLLTADFYQRGIFHSQISNIFARAAKFAELIDKHGYSPQMYNRVRNPVRFSTQN